MFKVLLESTNVITLETRKKDNRTQKKATR